METEKVYIVISRYAMRENNISMTILSTIEEAMVEATHELSAIYVRQVEIFEADKAQYAFFGRRIFNKMKR